MSIVVEEIKSKLNIVDLIGEYVRLQKAGASWKACCPFHNEKTPSFSVSEDKQVWHCFGCGKGGDAFGFIMEIEGLEFREALESLAQKTGVEVPEYTKGDAAQKKERNKIWDILDLSTKFYKKQLWEGEGKKDSLKYLKERGLS
jgi:DNA primase